jgi:hypothetical protein
MKNIVNMRLNSLIICQNPFYLTILYKGNNNTMSTSEDKIIKRNKEEEEKKKKLLVEEKQPENPLPIGEGHETKVIDEEVKEEG